MADTRAFRKRKVMSGKSPYGMVSTASHLATEAGVTILEKGGNAIDAAVAAAFCLCVTEPQASGIGGQSMFLIHLAGRIGARGSRHLCDSSADLSGGLDQPGKEPNGSGYLSPDPREKHAG